MLGLGDGKVEIQLNKFNFSPGETIQGKVLLKLNKILKAKELNIELFGEKKTRTISSRGAGNTRTIKVYSFRLPLDVEKDYPSGEKLYNFSIKIPSDILDQQKLPEGTVGTIIKAIQIFSGGERISWYLQATLQRPLSIDINRKVQINVV